MLSAGDKNINAFEIVASLPVAIFLGYLCGHIIQTKRVNRLAQKFNISNRFGDESLLMHYLNDPTVDWVQLRDEKNKLCYSGQVHKFAEDGSFKEIVLLNVTVYNSDTGVELYKVARVYLRFQGDDITIEEQYRTE